MKIQYLACDFCPRVFATSREDAHTGTLGNLRHWASKQGWVFRLKADYCPDCAATIPRKRGKP